MASPDPSITNLIDRSNQKLVKESRKAAQTYLQPWFHKPWHKPQLEALREQAHRISTVYLTDLGQSFYLQALVHSEHQQWQEALSLVELARTHEGEHLSLLRLKAQCEFNLKDFKSRLSTLEALYRLEPWNLEFKENLVENYYHEGYPDKVLEVTKMTTESVHLKTYSLLILSEKKPKEVLPQLLTLTDHATKETPAVLWFALGRAYEDKGSHTESHKAYKTFLAKTANFSLGPTGWDPYRLEDKRKVAQAELKETPPATKE